MAEYIERDAAIDGLREHLRYMLDGAPISVGTKEIYEMAYRHCIDKINSIPAADVLGVVHSFWGYNPGDNTPYCDNCGMPQDMPSDFCHSCNADMRETNEK